MLKATLVISLVVVAVTTAWAEVGGQYQAEKPSEGSDIVLYLTQGSYRWKINAVPAAGTVTGTFIDEPGCYGGDVRGLMSGGIFSLINCNWNRYDGKCDYLIQGNVGMPPVPYTWMNEIGTLTGNNVFVNDVPDAWFHESCNDGVADGWIVTTGAWAVNPAIWDPSMTYDVFGVGASAWMLSYYLPFTYPRPGDYGYQYEACFRKNSGNPGNSMALYFNGNGTMANCIIVCHADGWYSAWEYVGGVEFNLIPWIADDPCLFKDTTLDCENVWNRLKVNVYDNGLFDIFLNGAYVNSAQASANFVGYVGLAVYDGFIPDDVSCDNMTVSTVPLEWESVVGRTIEGGTETAEGVSWVSPEWQDE